MNRARITLLTAGFAAICCAAYAADMGGTALLPADSAFAFKLSSAAGEFAKMSTVAVKGQPFSSALRIEVSAKPRRPADVQISAPAGAATAGGDVLMVSFWMRSTTPGEAALDAGFRPMPGAGGAPGAAGRAGVPSATGAPGRAGRGMFVGQPALNALRLAPASHGRRYRFPFALARAYDEGEAEVLFTLGIGELVVEISGVGLVDSGADEKDRRDPVRGLGYAGNSPTPPGAKPPEAGIERGVRQKAISRCVVKDESGEPGRGAQVCGPDARATRPLRHSSERGPRFPASALTRGPGEIQSRMKVRLFDFAVMEDEMNGPSGPVWRVPRRSHGGSGLAARQRAKGARPQPVGLALLKQRGCLKAAQDARFRCPRRAGQGHYRPHGRGRDCVQRTPWWTRT